MRSTSTKTAFTPEQELEAIVNSVERWLPDHPDHTVAILSPRNERGNRFVFALQERGIPYHEMLRSSRDTRNIAGVLGTVLGWLAEPASASKLARACEAWRREDRDDPETGERLQVMLRALRRCIHVEDYLWPRPDVDELSDCLKLAEDEGDAAEMLLQYRGVARRWQAAVVLPIDQLMLTVAQDLFYRPADLALAHKLAVELRQAGDAHPEWELRQLVDWLAEIARNERRYLGFSDAEMRFDPEAYRGKVVITTTHKAKGLEWDRVYLSSVNSYDFPSALPGDDFMSEKWFIRENLNLEAEALAQLRAALAGDMTALYEPPGKATAGGAQRVCGRTAAAALRGDHTRKAVVGGDVEHRQDAGMAASARPRRCWHCRRGGKPKDGNACAKDGRDERSSCGVHVQPGQLAGLHRLRPTLPAALSGSAGMAGRHCRTGG